ncbi:FAD-binding oxidoreductase [Paracoccus nototheniae]|uniref:NAD(P)/FAD-dependent oxidoreductase n=1 Tax=Paracoccus nototheniae TaxID=2489002 RepID=UPI00103D31C1|nr:FAD-binding oxidoreductase [Paracoccus nototheniae]
MPAPLMTIASTPEPPATADVVVIGGGIVGVCTAWFLRQAGLSVALIEKGRIGAEQSSRNWGWCRQQNRDARLLGMATASLTLWEQIMADTGEDLGFRRCGLVYVSDDEAELEGWAKWCDFGRAAGVETQMLGADAASDRGGVTGKRWRGGVWAPTDGIADTASAAPRIARAVMAAGGSVHQFCAARGIETEAGRIASVVTESGTIRTQAVVVAGGAWTSSFCRQLGISFPQATIRASALSLMPGAPDVPDAFHSKEATLTRRADGALTLAVSQLARVDPTPQSLRYAWRFLPMFLARRDVLSAGDLRAMFSGQETLRHWAMDKPTPMERHRILDPRPDADTVARILDQARRFVPQLTTLPVQAAWSGFIDSTPDGLPVIDAAPGPEGLVLASGFSGQGFGTGPGAGRLAADLVMGRTSTIPSAGLELARLHRGRAKVAGM